jgi:hypothetical protein
MESMSSEGRGRQLGAGQSSRIHVYDVATGEDRVVFASDSILVEAPNVLDDETLIVNGDGGLFRLTLPSDGRVLDHGDLERIPLHGVPEINNDHVLDPSGTSVVVSARDGELYRIPLPGGTHDGPAVTITDANEADPVVRKFYLHGIHPDGSKLAAIVGELSEDRVWTTDVAIVDAETGEPDFLTRDEHPDDGCSFSPDGKLILFNTERFSPGTAQLAVDFCNDTEPVRLTNDDRVNWFPHLSPDGEHLLYLSYEPGVQSHPADQEVELRMLPGALAKEGRQASQSDPTVLVRLHGGQGTINVPPWAPSSKWFAYADYPVG